MRRGGAGLKLGDSGVEAGGRPRAGGGGGSGMPWVTGGASHSSSSGPRAAEGPGGNRWRGG